MVRKIKKYIGAIANEPFSTAKETKSSFGKSFIENQENSLIDMKMC